MLLGSTTGTHAASVMAPATASGGVRDQGRGVRGRTGRPWRPRATTTLRATRRYTGGVDDASAARAQRWQAMLEAGIAVASGLELDEVLRRLVQAGRELTGARYSALGVLDETGSELAQFITSGLDDEQRRLIGPLPRGRGILGVLIRDAKPLRLADLGDDPRSVGFPPHHPPMHSFLGVPVTAGGAVFGNLYLTERADGGVHG